MAGRLEGKIALITGTGGGQGRAAAVLFAKEGAKVVGCDIKADSAEETVEMAKATGGEMVSLQPLDLSDGNQVKKLIDFTIQTYGHLDILYNNAGASKYVPFDELTEQDWHFSVHNELDPVYYACHYAWPYLKANGNSVIINTASIAGIVGNAWVPPYRGIMSAHCATKNGIRGLTRQLALEGGPFGIRVIALCPGSMEMESILQDPERRERALQWVPLHRLAKPDDIANVALFLASDEASYITGVDIVVDGGIQAH